MKGLPFDRARLDDPALGRAERVQAGRQQRVQSRRERPVLGALAHVGRELLEEERIAARPRHHLAQRRLGQRQPGAEQAAARRVVQRSRAQDRPPPPRRPRGEQLGAPDAQQQDRRRQRAVRELVDEVEQRRLGPVGVLEGQHQRAVRAASAVSSIRNAHGAASAEASAPRPRVAAIVAAAARPSWVGAMTEVSVRPRSAWSTISRSGQ